MEYPMGDIEKGEVPVEENEASVQGAITEPAEIPTPMDTQQESFPTEESKEGETKVEDPKSEEKKSDTAKTGLKIRIPVPKKEPQCKEGTNIHFGADGKKLCSFSNKTCYQRRLENFGFCIKHILEDPQAPFQQCQFISKQKSRQCSNPVAISRDEDSTYCMTHKQALGLLSKKVTPKKAKKPKDAINQEQKAERRKKLMDLLSNEGIEHSQYIAQMRGQSKASDNGADADWESSSSSSASDVSSDDESDESSDDGDDFMSTLFLEELQRQEEDEPDYLRDVTILTEEEVVMRRKQKIKKLLKLYKLQFHRLRDILRTKHRKFIKKKQMLEKRSTASKRMLKDPEARKQQKLMHQYNPLKNAENQVKFISKEKKRRRSNDERKGQKTCSYERCKGKCIPLSEYCYAHILKDHNQKLFTNCSYVSPTGASCSYPILVGQSPAYCNGHIDLVTTKEPKPAARKRKNPGEGEEKSVEPKKKQKEEKSVVPPTKVAIGDALTKRAQTKKTGPEKPTNAQTAQQSAYFPSMQSPVFLPHLLARGNPGGVPMAQYLNPRMYEGLRKVSMDGKDAEESEQRPHKVNMNPMAMGGRPEATFVPTFFYHPGLLFNQPMKMPTSQEHPPPEGEKKS